MPLSWNEIKHRAIKFGNDWKNETREAAERQAGPGRQEAPAASKTAGKRTARVHLIVHWRNSADLGSLMK